MLLKKQLGASERLIINILVASSKNQCTREKEQAKPTNS